MLQFIGMTSIKGHKGHSQSNCVAEKTCLKPYLVPQQQNRNCWNSINLFVQTGEKIPILSLKPSYETLLYYTGWFRKKWSIYTLRKYMLNCGSTCISNYYQVAVVSTVGCFYCDGDCEMQPWAWAAH